MNRLQHETSPYLQQHADNPVDWYPWNEEALQLAREQGKPILLSIGYSACHWCHVMAHESFEDPKTAALMNDLFINIKVDREERPDIDKIYQTAQHLITQQNGGWPLTMFLNHTNQIPFFGGTYFPPEPRYGMPAFSEVLTRVNEFYQGNQDEIVKQEGAIVNALNQLTRPSEIGDTNSGPIGPEPLINARRQIESAFDSTHGGFTPAPKFPHLTNVEFLFWRYDATKKAGAPDENGLNMALFSLRKMALGGLYDHLGGGFCRYSVDSQWMIPHFEKMLYDNGPFLASVSQAWQLTQDPVFKRAAEETAEWVQRDMQAPEGGYYSSLDADSEGEEGKFYVWTPDEVKALLNDQQYAVFAQHFGLDRTANFEGHWHLHTYVEREALAEEFSLSGSEVDELLDSARVKLREARDSQRIWPGRDDKVLTAWNALMIKGMAVAGQVFEREEYLDSAQRALDFIRNTLWQGGRLLATYKDGRAHLNAYLDDYAFLLDAILQMLQARWRSEDLQWAIELADALLAHFEDTEEGGFFFTSHDHETLIQRPKPLSDDATPAGIGVVTFALGRLGHIVADMRYLQAAERALSAAWPAVAKMPYAHTSSLLTLSDYLAPPTTIILRGELSAMKTWQDECLKHYASQQLCFSIPADAEDLPEVLQAMKPNGEITAYVCSGHQCSPPVKALSELQALLNTQ
ncbi:MAG: thioredoxin domain-containing protein [Pseudomonadota bacterium]